MPKHHSLNLKLLICLHYNCLTFRKTNQHWQSVNQNRISIYSEASWNVTEHYPVKQDYKFKSVAFHANRRRDENTKLFTENLMTSMGRDGKINHKKTLKKASETRLTQHISNVCFLLIKLPCDPVIRWRFRISTCVFIALRFAARATRREMTRSSRWA